MGLSVTPVSLAELGESVSLADETTTRRFKLECPEEVSDLLEVGSTGVNLMDHVLNAVDTKLAQLGRDHVVVLDTNALASSGGSDANGSTLIDKLTDHAQGRSTVSDKWLDVFQHLLGSSVDFDEDTVVDLEESEKLEDFLGLGGNLVDTAKNNFIADENAREAIKRMQRSLPLDSDHEENLGVCGLEEPALGTSKTLASDFLGNSGLVALFVL